MELFECLKSNGFRIEKKENKIMNTSKIIAIEKVLEKLLLILGGMAVTGILTRTVIVIRTCQNVLHLSTTISIFLKSVF
jgi:peroxiredoxin